MQLLLALLALLGHGFLWAAFFNHSHATAMSRRILDPLTLATLATAALLPIGLGSRSLRDGLPGAGPGDWSALGWIARLYLGACCIAGAGALARWILRQPRRPAAVLRSDRRRVVDLGRRGGPSSPQNPKRPLIARLPGNQVLELSMVERAIEIPRLPPALDRLTVVHLSDFHMTGYPGRAYFTEAVKLSNQWEPDLVAITGDLVDRPECLGWLPETIGQLTGRFGVYFVLGNHDHWVDTEALRQALTDHGLIDLGGRWTEAEIRGERVILAGNELPWSSPAADFEDAPPPSAAGGPLRIVLAHSPDQLGWARACGVDLLLAGHTHGGQICLPLAGPIVSATHLGTAYASGVFHEPPTVMQVSSGVSAEIPVRLWCPPEIIKLVLRAAL